MAEKAWSAGDVPAINSGELGDGTDVTFPAALSGAKRRGVLSVVKIWLESNLTLAQARITGLVSALAAKADQTSVDSNFDSVATALSLKSNVGHTHSSADISDNDVLNGSADEIVMFDSSGNGINRTPAYLQQRMTGTVFVAATFSTTTVLTSRTVFVAGAADVGKKFKGLGQVETKGDATTITAARRAGNDTTSTEINAAAVTTTPTDIIDSTPVTLALGDRIEISTGALTAEISGTILLEW
jgi:hypothetical protein